MFTSVVPVALLRRNPLLADGEPLTHLPNRPKRAVHSNYPVVRQSAALSAPTGETAVHSGVTALRWGLPMAKSLWSMEI